ncbi:hypothetical protein [Tropicimonas sp. IMCC34043]|uniref:hypothetical protein n=1 Tax=Tropicimonas sp. IMCC34043 TaxID=2248760 RepID=UPI000E27851E|nr:hypothetical protein [Tropicimonas sp. IMCC34043]
MTRLLSAVAIVALTATTAFAASHNTALKAKISTYLTQQNIDYDVDTLSDEQLASIDNILNQSGSLDMTKKAAIAKILGMKE